MTGPSLPDRGRPKGGKWRESSNGLSGAGLGRLVIDVVGIALSCHLSAGLPTPTLPTGVRVTQIIINLGVVSLNHPTIGGPSREESR